MKNKLKENGSSKNWNIGCGIGVLGLMSFVLIRGRIWEQHDLRTIYRLLSDSFFVTGAIFFGLWLIWAATIYGPLGSWGYGARKTDMQRRKRKSKNGDEVTDKSVEQMSYLEYQEFTKKKNSLHLEMMLVGVTGIIIGAIFSMLFSAL